MEEGKPRKAGPLQVARAVFWSFLGIRRRTAHEADAAQIKPAQVVIAGIIGAVLFIIAVLVVVRIVLSNATG